jgi:DNA-binding Lrp family transcriptional regulator
MPRRDSKTDTYMRILRLVKEGASRPEIEKALGLYPSKAQYYLARLEKAGLIRTIRSYPRTYELTAKGLRVLLQGDLQVKTVRPTGAPGPKQVRVHAVQIIIPVLKQGETLPMKKEIPLKGWVQRIVDISDLGIDLDATIEITSKHVRVYVHSFNVKQSVQGWVQVAEYIGKIVNVVWFAMRRYGWDIDNIHYKVVNQHLENPAPEYEKVAQGEVETHLGRQATSIAGNTMNQPAKAWTDKSPGVLTMETNDALYEQKLLLMPEYVDAMYNKVVPLMDEYNKNIALHLDTLREMKQAIQELRDIMRTLAAK